MELDVLVHSPMTALTCWHTRSVDLGDRRVACSGSCSSVRIRAGCGSVGWSPRRARGRKTSHTRLAEAEDWPGADTKAPVPSTRRLLTPGEWKSLGQPGRFA